jgi:pyruvate-ferredoxin/flavodoxin oxidoreductase
MSKRRLVTIDGNEAAAHVAYLANEVIAIYPITPSSPMGELADEWAAQGRKNLWGSVPSIIEMQSEAGAAGALHGALTSGALATTFTASQGLLLMIPNMYKIAGELTPAVFHVAARTIATHALSIFGDHSDVMAARTTGWAMLASNSPQEAMDMALIAQAATLEGRVPIVHFFDGFRTSHEIAKIEMLDDDTLRAMLSAELIAQHRARSLSPERPVLRGSSQNPDVFFQSRERANSFYQAMPGIVQAAMDRFAQLTGRRYRLFDYVGAPDAERVLVLMGSGAETAEETVEDLNAQGARVGLLKVRLYRPFAPQALVAALPDTVRAVAVLDRCKEPGADGDPLYKDVLGALAQDAAGGGRFRAMPTVIGGRYGLSSKEFAPGMVKGVFDELTRAKPKREFTVGIHDDVTHLSLPFDEHFRTSANRDVFSAVFYGLGSDGTVSANKNSIKIIGESATAPTQMSGRTSEASGSSVSARGLADVQDAQMPRRPGMAGSGLDPIGESTGFYVQGYFVYDSKKAGAVTVSHLRFGPRPIRSAYLIGADEARFVGCHQPVFLERYDLLDRAAEGGVFLLNSPAPSDKVWDTLPRTLQQQLIDKRLKFYVIDAYAVAEAAGMGRRINTVMQTCFFAISGILPREQAIVAIKDAVEKTYGRKGRRLIELNFKAIDMALAHLHEVKVPVAATSTFERPSPVAANAPSFVQRFTAELIAERGDRLPVSLMPIDGTFPLGTAAFEKRNLALEIPVWEPDLCTQCGKCVFVCPHSVIRSKIFPAAAAAGAPPTFKHVPVRSKGYPAGLHMSYQVAPEDCTGCAICVEACPIHDKSNVSRKAINMAPQPPLRAAERDNWEFFVKLPESDRALVKPNTIPGSMLLDPLFEFSGACSGCGETPYLRLATQLFGDRMLVANATGCSSIYGGNLPTTPWTTNKDGRGPAWSNSLFEDNAEFGLGMRLACNELATHARALVREHASAIGTELAETLLGADQTGETGIHAQRERVAALREKLRAVGSPRARELEAVAEYLVRRSVWIVGGDGWAYDIGYGGLDHVLASSHDVNILVLDTEVYSNTGGQTSKSTPLGAVAKFSASGKPTRKKDLARLAMDYGHVYVAQVAFGAKDVQTLRVFLEAEAYPGPSLIIAYSPCIAHGVDLSHNLRQQELAVKSGHWSLFRYDPREAAKGVNPLRLDSAAPSIPFREFAQTEARFTMLARTHPQDAERYVREAERAARQRFHEYEDMSKLPVQTGANKPAKEA